MKKLEPKKPGRPVLPPEQAQTAMIRERVTPAQRQEYEKRGAFPYLVLARVLAAAESANIGS